MKTFNFWTALFGGRAAHREHSLVVIAMLFVAVLYEAISAYLISDFSFNGYEFIGTWAGLVCVLCWPWGIASALAFGYFFGLIGLPGQQWLNWGYFLVIQFLAWPHWAFGGKDRTELPVTSLTVLGRIVTLLVLIVGTYCTYRAIAFLAPGSLFPILDATVVASSIVAQFLMGRKKVESWFLWLGPVNLLSIVLFFSAGAYTVMALYVAFFIHACFAVRSWQQSQKVTQV
jgi:nicotinamide mononucleotide transporter